MSTGHAIPFWAREEKPHEKEETREKKKKKKEEEEEEEEANKGKSGESSHLDRN